MVLCFSYIKWGLKTKGQEFRNAKQLHSAFVPSFTKAPRLVSKDQPEGTDGDISIKATECIDEEVRELDRLKD